MNAATSTSSFDVNNKLEAAIVEYLEFSMWRSNNESVDDAYELLMNEVEATFQMFSASFRK